MTSVDCLPGSAPQADGGPHAKISSPAPPASIIDIRRDREQHSLQSAIHQGLRPPHGAQKRLPTLLLYDEAGLKLFEKITYLEEYYLTNAEINVLEENADQIAKVLQPGSIVLELGSGNLRKVNILLQAIERLGKHVDYYALDLSLPELERTLAEVPQGVYSHVHFYGLHGTYDDGLEWLKRPEIRAKQKAVLWLGSSIGNFSRREASEFLKTFTTVLQNADSMLIGMDSCKNFSKVQSAYNDREGVTHEFYANGLLNANCILGNSVFNLDNWLILGEYNQNEGCHQAFISPKEDTEVLGVMVRVGEKVLFEEAYKYDSSDIDRLWKSSGATETLTWWNKLQNYGLHMIMAKKFAFPATPQEYASQPVPTWDQWTELWAVWDAVTRQMLPDEELLEKPIKLRNACIFYLGHIPTFFDMKITFATGGKPTPPDYFPKIFERGIDPDVDNPENCHSHSEIPDEWPPLDEILAFQDRVRERVRGFYTSGEALNPKLGRVLWLGYEHEAMHLETLLYMLVQSDKTLPPPGIDTPDFQRLSKLADAQFTTNEWFTVPGSEVQIGLDDPENDSGPSRFFGWDMEKPARKVHVPAFSAQARPISIGDYAEYLQENDQAKIPASWMDKPATNGHANGNTDSHTNGYSNGEAKMKSILSSYSVRTVHGPVPLKFALSWPVSASYDELAGCAAWMGGRIPTFEEARSIYQYVDQQSRGQTVNASGKRIPAVNGHLLHDGVEETPPPSANANGAGINVGTNRAMLEGAKDLAVDPRSIFVDLEGCNVGFQHWHSTSVTHKGSQLCGQADFGGLWEWTSTPLSKHDGYAEMPLYPAYSADFFDGKHNIVLGGSWATVPRLAGRKSFVNWYQRNYPYVWAGARVVKDL